MHCARIQGEVVEKGVDANEATARKTALKSHTLDAKSYYHPDARPDDMRLVVVTTGRDG